MKLLIQTQIHENYGAHAWDGNGPCPSYHWKAKGGDTYVVRYLTEAQVAKISSDGIPTLRKLIESNTDYFKVSIIAYGIHDDLVKETEDWETPADLYWEDGKWKAIRVTSNEHGEMKSEIDKKIENWIPTEAGGISKYKVQFYDKDGRMLDL